MKKKKKVKKRRRKYGRKGLIYRYALNQPETHHRCGQVDGQAGGQGGGGRDTGEGRHSNKEMTLEKRR